MKTALITGITGQDGYYLSEYLLNLGYEVHGFQQYMLPHELPYEINSNIKLHIGDMTDFSSINRVICNVHPDEIYNLAAITNVANSFEMPEYVANVNALGIIRILDSALVNNIKTRIYQASTSEMFGNSPPLQNEQSIISPRSPYAASKAFAHYISLNYREAYGMYVVCGILFNHESVIRSPQFVTRKITKGLTRIKLGLQDCLHLGNLNSKRDWGHAKDYVRAQYLMLQQKEPKDYVISTGNQYSVRELVNIVAHDLDLNITWHGSDINECAYDTHDKKIITVDQELFRPTDVENLLGDSSKAREDLGWEPKISFYDMINEMVCADLKLAQEELNYTKI